MFSVQVHRDYCLQLRVLESVRVYREEWTQLRALISVRMDRAKSTKLRGQVGRRVSAKDETGVQVPAELPEQREAIGRPLELKPRGMWVQLPPLLP